MKSNSKAYLAKHRPGLLRAKRRRENLTKAGIPVLGVMVGREGKDATDHVESGLGIEDFDQIDLDDALARRSEIPPLELVDGGVVSSSPPAPPTPSGDDDRTPHYREEDLVENDLDNAELFVRREGADFHFCSELGGWMSWNGRCWDEDRTAGASVKQRWVKLARGIEKNNLRAASALRAEAKEAKSGGDDVVADRLLGQSKGLSGHAKYCQSTRAFSAMETMARGWDGIPLVVEDLDQHRHLLTVRNGMLDLETCTLREHDRGALLTKAIDVEYDPSAECPTFEKFLRWCTEENYELGEMLQMMAGYCLTGYVHLQEFYFLQGKPGSGKTTMVNVLRNILGPYSKELNKKHLMRNRFSEVVPEHLARLRGSRVVFSVEVGAKDRFDEEMMKTISGEEPIVARKMRENSIEFWAQFKLFVTGNFKPRVDDQGDSFWRRFTVIPFNATLSAADRDNQLPLKLRAESAGILAWMVEGWRKLQEAGVIVKPKIVQDYKQEYRDDVDIIGAFLNEYTDIDPDGRIRCRDLHQKFAKWCEFTGERSVSEKEFSLALQQRDELRQVKPGNVSMFVGREWKPGLDGQGTLEADE